MLGALQLDQIPDKGVSLRLTLSMDKFTQLVCYPVIVEMWEKKNGGRVKRQWLKTFDKSERRKIACYYSAFYKWHLVTGPPRTVMMKISTLDLLQRAANFFGTI